MNQNTTTTNAAREAGQIESFHQHGVAIYGENGTEIIRIQPTDNYVADKVLALRVSRLLWPVGALPKEGAR